MSLGKILDISKNSLSVYKQALDVTSNNIANASNADYSKQTVILTSERSDGILGSGVKIADVSRAKSDLIDKQLLSYNPKYYEADERSTIISQMESLIQEPSDNGISTYLNNFYNSWTQLATNSSSTALRLSVVQAAGNLTNKFNDVYQGIDEMKGDIVSELKGDVSDLNDNLSQVQELNSKIFAAKTTGQDASDLMDQRDKVVSEISQMANVNVTQNDSGDYVVSVGGVYAADRFSSTAFQVQMNNGELTVGTSDSSTPMQLTSGKMYAMTDMYSNKLPEYQQSLDSIASALVDTVNSIHSTGTNLNGETGVNFFDDYTSGNLKVSNKITKDSNAIAVSSDGTSGNGTLATKIADSKSSKVIDGVSIPDYYNSLVSTIGSDKTLSDQNSAANKLVVDQLTNQKASVTGVSLDEEMTNVIKFQRSYDASAKLIKVADEMLQTLIEMV